MLPLFAILALGFAACDDDDDARDAVLDPALFGRWELRNPAGNVPDAWEFNDDGTTVQFIHDDEIDWIWEIEGHQLFFWVEELEMWGFLLQKYSMLTSLTPGFCKNRCCRLNLCQSV